MRACVLASTVVLLAGVATACGADRPGQPATPPDPTNAPTAAASSPPGSPTDSSTSPSTGAALRTRLADALRAQDPASADLVAGPASSLTVLDTDWLPGWQVVDVHVRSVPHPRRFSVGLSADGSTHYLTGTPRSFAAMVRQARVRLTASTAAALCRTFLDTTRTFERFSYRVDAVHDIRWRSDLSPVEQEVRDQVEHTYAAVVQPPRATAAGDGWTVTGWMVEGDTLVRHDVTLTSGGAPSDRREVVVRDLPVPDSR